MLPGIVISIIQMAVVAAVWEKYGVISVKQPLPAEEPGGQNQKETPRKISWNMICRGIHGLWENVTQEKKQWILLFLTGILTAALNVLLFRQGYRVHTFLNILAVYTILTILAGIDRKKKIIPNKILAAGFAIRLSLLLPEWFLYPDTIKGTMVNMAAGFAFGLLFLLVLSFLTRHGIGYGDVKMFAWLGFCVGFLDTYYILFYSVLTAAVAGSYLLLVRKVEKKQELPFAPFVYVGCYLVFCMTFLRG